MTRVIKIVRIFPDYKNEIEEKEEATRMITAMLKIATKKAD